MIKNFLLLLGLAFFFLSCEKAQDTKGETIPPAFVFQKTQRPEIIVAYLTKLLENQDGSNLYFLRAKAFFDLRNYQKAQDDIEQALKQVPSDVDYLLLSAQIKGQIGLLTAGIEDAKLVESSGLVSAKLYMVLAELYFNNHEKRRGYSYLIKVQQVGIPKSEKPVFHYLARQFRADSLGALQSISLAHCQYAYLANAYFHYQIGRLPNIQYQKQILAELKKYPMDPYLMHAWGDFLVHVGQYLQAEKVYKQVQTWLPQHPGMHLRFAQFYMNRRQYELANAQLLQIPSGAFEYRDALYSRALIQMNIGQKSASIALLDSARKIYISDGRFTALYDRLVGKRIDSNQISQDTAQQILP